MSTAADVLEPEWLGRAPTFSERWRKLQRLPRQYPLGTVGLFLLLVVAAAAITAPFSAPYDPNSTIYPLLESPSWSHPFGTDRLGRDVLSRVIYGARVSMAVGFGSVAAGVLVGALVGLVGGYAGGLLDDFFQRLVDVMLAFPLIILAMFLAAAAGQGIDKMIFVLAIAIAPAVARVARGSVLSEREKPYIEAARALGAGQSRIMFRHILPNIGAPIIVLATTLLAGVVLAEASLSFLGLGIPISTPSWGGDLSGNARSFFEIAPWMAIFPGLALMITVLGFNFFGDAVRDILDPRLRGSMGRQ